VHLKSKQKATLSVPKKRAHASGDERPANKFNRKPKEKKFKPKKTAASKDGAIKDGFRANKPKKTKPAD
jgi:hypothetical protein